LLAVSQGKTLPRETFRMRPSWFASNNVHPPQAACHPAPVSQGFIAQFWISPMLDGQDLRLIATMAEHGLSVRAGRVPGALQPATIRSVVAIEERASGRASSSWRAVHQRHPCELGGRAGDRSAAGGSGNHCPRSPAVMPRIPGGSSQSGRLTSSWRPKTWALPEERMPSLHRTSSARLWPYRAHAAVNRESSAVKLTSPIPRLGAPTDGADPPRAPSDALD